MLQDPEIITHRLRLRYLSQIQDGVGERIIDFSQTKTNTTAFKIAGGDPKLMDRCVSPEIPTYDVTDSGVVGQMRNGLVSPVSTQLSEEVESGGTLRRTITDLSLTAKRSRSNLHEDLVLSKLNPALRDDEASDQSDISDNEDTTNIQTYGSQQKHLFMIDLHKRIAEEPKFQKMPIRRRGISDASVSYKASVLPPARRPTFSVSRNGSESDLSRAGGQSIVSNGFLPLLPGLPYEAPVIDISQSGTSTNAADFQDVLAAFDVADDTSEDEYDVGDSSLPIVSGVLSTSFLDMQPITPSTFMNINGGQPSLGPLAKSKPRPESVFQPSSGLTAMLKASRSAEVDPLESKYGVLNGKGDLKPLKLKIYRPTSSEPAKPFVVVIRSAATVLETIGYALLRYIEEKREPRIKPEQKDPNLWTLRIVEDDGELDHDFPALERTRPISKFSFDEFAIVEATAAQVLENQTLTPDALGTKSNLKTIPEVSVVPSSGPSSLQTKPLGPGTIMIESNLVLPSAAPSVASGMQASVPRPVARAPGASVLLKVRLKPDSSMPAVLYAQTTVLDVTTETYLGDVLDQVCRKRNLDKYMFSLRLVGTNMIVPSDRTVESLQGRTELLLVRKKATDLLTDVVAPRSMTPNAPIVTGTYTGLKSSLGDTGGSSNYIPDLVTANTYQHWVVWRRQPMSFMGRHERILAIDGEYVHISPSEAKTMFESPKTSSIHVGQIIACKQSRKIPVNFKIMIIKVGQTKRYDFEAIKPQEAETIVNKIKTLTRNWASQRGIRSSRMVS
ncbi:Putative uncharacterized protein [Taphrina deformans PYCC 5710]|uniref:Stress activated MAP kinase interacting protein n=1 Tax=Taphrina deformans (strain PYCC 5710 / ATCC 11124 / CBS 356.35 / IMI 108563 / JCM 9778 / NBRC 8474) TaxID=1097556 RepID=R4X819_TAPDE|nr:Putative uncharacterized protein [Taphrina deformans PYCC 5710]|eukprot:CCG81397.1 Putative uncharacterized protein [Taphrina deformans PYCC 5710]